MTRTLSFCTAAMDLQRIRAGGRRGFAFLRGAILACLTWTVASVVPLRAADNGGLGPLTLRNQFPPALAHLSFTPEAPLTLRDGTFKLTYQYERSNTFINTQSARAKDGPVITETEVARGLTLADFRFSGYALYLDLESVRHVVRMAYGLGDSLELGLELAWLGYGGGFLDSNIEGVERFFGGLNPDRTLARQNRFDYYIVRNGRFLQATSQSFSAVAQDPVVNLKWNWGEGGDVLPAVSLKLAYKAPLTGNPTGNRALISSGKADYGYYLLVSKAVGDVVGHFQFGQTVLGVEPDTYTSRIQHKLFALEFRLGAEDSLLLQSLTQTSLFRHSDFFTDNTDYTLSQPTDLLQLGYKHRGKVFHSEVGLSEDYNQGHNEADFTLYLNLGWQW
jgi:hypothetical protein